MIRENRLYHELNIGDAASIKRVCTANDLYIFAHASGNLNPLHLPDEERERNRRKRLRPPCGSVHWSPP
jgi:phosphate butyryltransferase